MILRLLFIMLGFFPAIAAAQTVAITGGTLPTAPGAGTEVTVVIVDGNISAIGSDVAVPPDARIIAADGRPITAPIFAAATQIGLVQLGASSSEDDSSAGSSGLGPRFDPARAFDPNALSVQLARADGVGRAMIYPGGAADAFAGTGALVDLHGTGNLVLRSGAALFAMGSSARAAAGGSRAAAWTQLRDRLNDAEGTDAPAALARAGTIPLVLVIDDTVDIDQALALKSEFPLDIVILGGAEAWRRAEELARADIAVVLDPLDELPFYYTTVGARRDNAAILAAAGVPIAFSVSAQGIYRSWNVASASRLGAGIAVANGLPYETALDAITASPARIWHAETPGGLRVGERADLVIWDGDPLEPASAPWMILASGREQSLDTRHKLLRDRYLDGE